MKLYWSKIDGNVEETFEIEAETVSNIIEVYQAIEGSQETHSQRWRKSILKRKHCQEVQFDCNGTPRL